MTENWCSSFEFHSLPHYFKHQMITVGKDRFHNYNTLLLHINMGKFH